MWNKFNKGKIVNVNKNFLNADALIANANISEIGVTKSYVLSTVQTINKKGDSLYQKKDIEAFNKLTASITRNNLFVLTRLSHMERNGLSYENDDYYIFLGAGSRLEIAETPQGLHRVVAKAQREVGLRVTINNTTIFKTDPTPLIYTKNGFDYLEFTPNVQSVDALLDGAMENKNQRGQQEKDYRKDVRAIISHIKVYAENGTLLSSKNIILSGREYQQILNTTLRGKSPISTAYFSTYIDKTIWKRIIRYLSSMLPLDGSIEQSQRVDNESPSVADTPTQEQPQQTEKQEQEQLQQTEKQEDRSKPLRDGKKAKEHFIALCKKEGLAISVALSHLATKGITSKLVKHYTEEEIEKFIKEIANVK
jgi:hypothetical protein